MTENGGLLVLECWTLSDDRCFFLTELNCINYDNFTYIAFVWVHFPASFDKALSNNIKDISWNWTNCCETEVFCFWNQESPLKISTFSNIDFRIILGAFDMIILSSVIEFLEALNSSSIFTIKRKHWQFSIVLFT